MENKNLLLSPAVSIVIPMYNAEKYIGDCLDSLLEQTSDNFEVILADDCSTDNSLKIAKSYLLKFAARYKRNSNEKIEFKLIKLNENSGGAAAPRNQALKFVRGEYLMFVDCDDALTPTAVEELYSLAKKLDADMLSSRRFYKFSGEKLKDSKPRVCTAGNPTGISAVENQMYKFAVQHHYSPMVWTYFFRSEMVLKNKIEFPAYPIDEDRFFVFCALFFAKKIFSVPNLYYYYRKHSASITSNTASPAEILRRRVKSSICGADAFDKFAKKFDFFKENPEITRAAFNRFFFDAMNPIYADKTNQKISLQEFDTIISDIFNDIDDKTSLATFLFHKLTTSQESLREKNAAITRLQEEIQAQKEQNQKFQEQFQILQSSAKQFVHEKNLNGGI